MLISPWARLGLEQGSARADSWGSDSSWKIRQAQGLILVFSSAANPIPILELFHWRHLGMNPWRHFEALERAFENLDCQIIVTYFPNFSWNLHLNGTSLAYKQRNCCRLSAIYANRYNDVAPSQKLIICNLNSIHGGDEQFRQTTCQCESEVKYLSTNLCHKISKKLFSQTLEGGFAAADQIFTQLNRAAGWGGEWREKAKQFYE